jgi:hypothetical protein
MAKTYLGASSGLDGKDPNVARIVVSLNRSREQCQNSDSFSCS